MLEYKVSVCFSTRNHGESKLKSDKKKVGEKYTFDKIAFQIRRRKPSYLKVLLMPKAELSLIETQFLSRNWKGVL